jgi:hypothetical protein
MTERIESRGWWVFSSTIELVPGVMSKLNPSARCGVDIYRAGFTEFYDDGELSGVFLQMGRHPFPSPCILKHNSCQDGGGERVIY